MDAQNPYRTPGASSPKPGGGSITDILFGFNGRIPRMTWWIYSLASGFGIGIVVGILVAILGPDSTAGQLVVPILYLPLVWIGLALQIKRWHDRGKSGWWVLIGFIPCVGPIWAFIELGCLPGTPGPNQFGPDPTQ